MQIKDDGTFHIVYRQFFVPETYSHLLTASLRRIDNPFVSYQGRVVRSLLTRILGQLKNGQDPAV